MPAPIVCIEGPSAVGKTTLAMAQAPGRVLKLGTDDRGADELVETVRRAVQQPPPPQIDPIRLLDSMAEWVASPARRL